MANPKTEDAARPKDLRFRPEAAGPAFWQKGVVIAGGPAIVLLMLWLGKENDLFLATNWYDVLMHFLGGGLLTVTLAGSFWHLRLKRSPGLPRPALFKTCLVAILLLTAVAWEIFEVLFHLTPNWTQSVGDTFSDIFWALAGATIALRFIRL